MPGAYRDNRETTRAQIAKLRLELIEHRVALHKLIDTRNSFLTRASRPRLLQILVAVLLGLACGGAALMVGRNIGRIVFGIGTATAVTTLGSGLITALFVIRLLLEGAVGENREGKIERLRVAETNATPEYLERDAEREQQTCDALEEEITEMMRLLDADILRESEAAKKEKHVR
jgi:hypothetical protein